MGVVIFFFLTVVALLLCTPRGERGLALGSMLFVGGVIWVAARINLSSILGSILGGVIALAWEYRAEILLVLGAAVVLIVPVLMIYVVVCDQFETRVAARSTGAGAASGGSGSTRESRHS